MATSTLKTRIKHKIDTASNWASSNLVPLEGELVIYKDDKPQIKVGDGSTAVGSLPFIKAGSDITVTQVIASGTKIASIEIDGVLNNLYAPSYSFSTGSANGTIAVNGVDVAVKGLGARAFDSTNYLPSIGGTIYNSGTHHPLTIKSNKTNESWIKFAASDDTVLGYLGALIDSNGTKSPMWFSSSNSIILHAGNYSNYALPLSGGTMTGSLSVNGGVQAGSVWSSQTSAEASVGVENKTLSSKLYLYNNSSRLGLYCTIGSDISKNIISIDSAGVTNFIGNASTATQLASTRTIFGQSFNGTADVKGRIKVFGYYNPTASTRFYSSGIEIWENDSVTSTKTDIGYAPSIGFHWNGVVGATMLLHSDGNFYLKKQDGTSRASLDANLIGNASTATALSSEISDSKLPIRLRENTSGTSANPDTFMSSGFYYAGNSNISNVGDANILTIAHTKNGWCHQLGFKFNGVGASGSSYDGADVYTRIYNGGNKAWSNWHVLLSSGNYTAYCAPASHSHNYLTGWSDSRNVTTTPNDYNSQLKVVGIKTPTGSGTLDGSSYSTLVGIRGWSDSSGGNSHELAFTGSGSLYRRHGSTTSWGSWIQILDSSNYTSYCAPAGHTHSYLPLAGGTMTGMLYINSNSWPQIGFNNASGRGRTLIYHDTSNGSVGSLCFRVYTDDTGSNYVTAYLNTAGGFYANTIHGAVWNDYAEFRQTVSDAKPGQIVTENGDGTQRVTTERLQRGCNVVSDTFGFAIGETDECKTPVACAGRALVYTYENRYDFQPGEAVCSGPNGTVSRMTREEMINNPDCIVGFVSEIPEYKVWGTGNVEVDGRIWIKVK